MVSVICKDFLLKSLWSTRPTTGDPRQPDIALTGISVPIGNRIVVRILIRLPGYTSDTLTLMCWLQHVNCQFPLVARTSQPLRYSTI